jgi:beta-glucosidase
MRLALVLALMLPAAAGAAGPGPSTPVERGADWWHARQRRIAKRLRRGRVDLLFLSITAGWEREGAAVWRRFYGKRRAVNAGIGGDETGHLLWRLARSPLTDLRPKLVVLLVGVNNAFRRDHSAAGIAAGVAKVVGVLRRGLPHSRILLLGIFPAGARPNKVRAKTRAVNRRIARLADNKRVFYLDLGDRFLGAGGRISTEVMHDHLHLTEKGYRMWAGAMEPTLRRLLGQ